MNTTATNQKYIAIALGIFVVLILAIWFSKSGTPPVAKTETTGTKVGCDRFTGDEKIACQNRIDNSNALTKSIAGAAEKLDPKLCDTVNEWARVACKDIVYFEIAMKSKQEKDCDIIQDQSKKSVCKSRLAPVTPPVEKIKPEVPKK